MGATRHSAIRAVAARLLGTQQRAVVGGVGLLLSVAIHLLFIQAIIWSSGGATRALQTHEGLGANALGATDEAAFTAFFIEDSSATDEVSPEDLASAGRVLQSMRLTIVSTDSSLDAALRNATLDESSTAQDAANLGEREARAALFGRYIGQIQARIERAWIRPRTNIGADLFECRVHVQQSTQGVVIEITLKECNGDARWQLSLVNAIQGASPLPSPPDPSVFANAIDLSFSSVAYTRDRTEQGYEPLTIAAFDNTTRFP